jgi:hypothetical protein
MNQKEYQILEQIRLIKKHIEESPMDFDVQYKCIDAMMKILKLSNINH